MPDQRIVFKQVLRRVHNLFLPFILINKLYQIDSAVYKLNQIKSAVYKLNQIKSAVYKLNQIKSAILTLFLGVPVFRYFMIANTENAEEMSLELLYKATLSWKRVVYIHVYYDNSLTIFEIITDLQLGKIYKDIINFALLL